MLPYPLGCDEVAKLNQYLTVGNAAAFLGVSKDTLRRWDRDGRLKARRHPMTRYRLYLKAELDILLRTIRKSVHKNRPSKPRR
jgi:excisionase family DNA binding protein